MIRSLYRCALQRNFQKALFAVNERPSSSTSADSKNVTFKSLQLEEAENFLNNLDSEQKKQKHKIELWIQILRERDNKVIILDL